MSEPATTFADRHLGPRPDDVERMLGVLGVATLDELIDQAVPKTIRTDQPLRLPDARSEPEVLATLRALAEPQPGGDVADRHRLPRHPHPRRDPAQRAREPGLVHGVHALPARDQPGSARGAPELPDDGHRPHRDGHRQRIDARRVHRRRRGDDADPPVHQARRRRPSSSTPRRTPRRSPWSRRGRSRSASSSSSATWPTSSRPRCSAPCSSTRARAGSCATSPPPSTPCTTRAGSSPSPPTCSPARSSRRRASRAPTCASGRRSASACRSATADRTPASWPRATGCGGRCPAGSWACPSMPPVAPPIDLPSRRASSTSAARRPRPTSAPPRCCSR